MIRFLKTQRENPQVKSLGDELKERGIDTSDLKDSVVAYINQGGVNNSGDIRGDVAFTSIKSFVFCRPTRSIVKEIHQEGNRPCLTITGGIINYGEYRP